jgi:hypothetical protein
MGFLDKAKAAANDLAAKADGAMAQAGINTPGSASGTSAGTDRLLRDLGVLAYLEATGREVPEGERDRVLAGLREAEQQGGFSSFALRTTPPPPPGMGGTAGAAGMPSSQASPPPPPPGQPQQAPSPGQSEQAPPPPPPPPPSWS